MAGHGGCLADWRVGSAPRSRPAGRPPARQSSYPGGLWVWGELCAAARVVGVPDQEGSVVVCPGRVARRTGRLLLRSRLVRSSAVEPSNGTPEARASEGGVWVDFAGGLGEAGRSIGLFVGVVSVTGQRAPNKFS